MVMAAGFPLSRELSQPERTPRPPHPSNPLRHQLPHDLQPHPHPRPRQPMAGARAEPDREAVLERPVALPGAVRNPGLARHHVLWKQPRYKQTFIGVAWALIRPFLTMMVFAAMLPWQFFSTALSSCSDSLVSNANLLT
jgi:hypothetical protein